MINLSKSSDAPIIVIIGRSNVGKSALFNALTKTKAAVVSPIPFTTRNQNYGIIKIGGKEAVIVDTGAVRMHEIKAGFSLRSKFFSKKDLFYNYSLHSSIKQNVVEQIKTSLRNASLVLMMVDGQEGVYQDDRILAEILEKYKQPKILVCNKMDILRRGYLANNFSQLAMGEPVLVSALKKTGIAKLEKAIEEKLRSDIIVHPHTKNFGVGTRPRFFHRNDLKPVPATEPVDLRIAIVGKPNVGKSSIFNAILRQSRSIVSNVSGTTLEPVEGVFTYQKTPILLYDTPGVQENTSKYDLTKEMAKISERIIDKADVVLFITEVVMSLTSQDRHLAEIAGESKKRTIILANKWDLFPRREKEYIQEIQKHYRNYLPKFNLSPLIFTSAKSGQGFDEVLSHILNGK